MTKVKRYGIINISNKKGFETMKWYAKPRLTWTKKKLRYLTANGTTHLKFEIIVETIKYLATAAIDFSYRFLRNLRKSIIQMTSMRAEYR